MKITKREVIFSVAIVCLMLVFGIMISGKISDSLMNQYQEYNTALQIDNNSSLFEYGMRTNIGNAFVYGELAAVDSVTYPEIGGEYASATKVTERYTKHTRTVTKTRTVNGKTETYTETETYWTWDEIDRDHIHVSTIQFLNREFPYGTIDYFPESYITTLYAGFHLRNVYYGSALLYEGTLYANLADNTITKTSFYCDRTINETIEHLETEWQLVLFWVFWIALTGFVVWGFYYIDNRWLE